MAAELKQNGVRQLTGELHGIVTDITGESRQELQQVRDLIAQSIAVLDLSFSAIAVGTDVQRELVGDLLNKANSDAERQSELLEKLELNNEEIHGHVAAAIRSLQFEDMVRQVVEHLDERLDSLGDITEQLSARAQRLESDAPQQYDQQLEQLGRLISETRENLRSSDHRAVTQSSMDEGDIDLF